MVAGVRQENGHPRRLCFPCLRWQHFIELAGDVPVLVEFIVSEVEADSLITALRRENLHLFYARQATDFDTIEPHAGT
jgi:hypothetical protein